MIACGLQTVYIPAPTSTAAMPEPSEAMKTWVTVALVIVIAGSCRASVGDHDSRDTSDDSAQEMTCRAYCEHAVSCDPMSSPETEDGDVEVCASECHAGVMDGEQHDGAACLDAILEMYQCLTSLTCDALLAGPGCDDEIERRQNACPSSSSTMDDG